MQRRWQRRDGTLHGRVYLYTFGVRRCKVLGMFELIHDLEIDILVRQQDIVVLVGFGFFFFLKRQSWY